MLHLQHNLQRSDAMLCLRLNSHLPGANFAAGSCQLQCCAWHTSNSRITEELFQRGSSECLCSMPNLLEYLRGCLCGMKQRLHMRSWHHWEVKIERRGALTAQVNGLICICNGLISMSQPQIAYGAIAAPPSTLCQCHTVMPPYIFTPDSGPH